MATRRLGLMTAGIAVLMATGVGCGGLDPSHAPLDAKKDDFCKAYTRLARADVSTTSSEMSDYLNEFARFGTPRGIPTAARNGFEYVIDPARGFKNGRQYSELAIQKDAAGQDAAALKTYAAGLCATK